MDIIGKIFWAMCIAVSIINGITFRKRTEEYILENPSLKNGYDKLIRGWFLFANLPWIVMGIGIVSGATQSVWDYFQPNKLNPMVLAFHGTIIGIWLLGSYWIFLNKGAEFLATHPGFIRYRFFGRIEEVTSPPAIKLFWVIAMAGGITAMVMMWQGFLQ